MIFIHYFHLVLTPNYTSDFIIYLIDITSSYYLHFLLLNKTKNYN
jgi:hypothetical protein